MNGGAWREAGRSHAKLKPGWLARFKSVELDAVTSQRGATGDKVQLVWLSQFRLPELRLPRVSQFLRGEGRTGATLQLCFHSNHHLLREVFCLIH